MSYKTDFYPAWSAFTKVYGDGSLDNAASFIGGKVKQRIYAGIFENACAIRISCVFNNAGTPISAPTDVWFSGLDGRRYIYQANLFRIYPGNPAAQDAKAATSGYMEFGSAELDVYRKSVGIVERKSKQVYRSMDGNPLYAMKCVDLFFDPGPDALARSIKR